MVSFIRYLKKKSTGGCKQNTEIIKKTYKKLVKKYHPDYNMGNKEYENKIKEINQAYNDIKDIK